MGRGIDRRGPSDSHIVSEATIVDMYTHEDDAFGDMWIEDLEFCISKMSKWSKPREKQWINEGRKSYCVLAWHEGALDAAIVASTDADHHSELFVVVERSRCDNPGLEALAEGMVHRWCQKLREALQPMSPKVATSPWTCSPIFDQEAA